MKILTRMLIVLLASGALVACGGDEENQSEENQTQENQTEENQTEENQTEENQEEELVDIVATAEAAGDFTTLLAGVEAAGLTETLQGEDDYSVFAPTDAAFDALPAGVLDDLLLPENQAQLEEILLFHVLPGTVLAADVAVGDVTTAAGIDAEITEADGALFYAGAEITTTDVLASNGVIHIIDAVAFPPADEEEEPDPTIVDLAVDTADFSTLVAALTEAGLVDTLSGDGPFTVFAPTNQAFEDAGIDLDTIDQDVLIDVLTYHVLAGDVRAADVTPGIQTALNDALVLIGEDADGLTYGGASITDTDIVGSNGVIHVIDEVVMPPEDVVDVAIANDFNTLVAAVQAADLEDTLRGEDGPYTVFAPTDAAFEALPEGTLDTLLEPENQQDLIDILLYHVLPAAVSSYEVEVGTATTVNGADAEIAADGDALTYAGATIVVTDVMARNGVVHVIDAVVLPPEE